jgi:hypothetical protein
LVERIQWETISRLSHFVIPSNRRLYEAQMTLKYTVYS